MRDQDYRTVTDYQPWPQDGPGLFMLEWDIALDAAHRARFAAHALADPDRVLVGPYRLYGPKFPGAPQCHRVRGQGISEGQEWCETWGLGCVYLPHPVLDGWRSSPDAEVSRWTDVAVSRWYAKRHGRARVDWSVQPQHLHGD